ncbi:sensor histidine kinase [Haloferula sp.]|uniref:sensor histidine kinase n=1 Tax=Haloferula sp. TaxID=2497595 RepID=UPI00329C33B6
MSEKPRFPLLVKMLMWLLIHFAVLAGAFAIFVSWQLQLGLDSVLSGAAGDRLKTLGDAVASDLKASNRSEWPEIIDRHVEPYGLDAMLILPRRIEAMGDTLDLPEDVDELLQEADSVRRPRPRPARSLGDGPPGGTEGFPPPHEEGFRPPYERGFRPPQDEGFPPPHEDGFPSPPGGRGRPGDGPRGFGPPGAESLAGGLSERGRDDEATPEVTPVFMIRSKADGDYWAAVDLPLFAPATERPLHGMLILRSNNASAAGLFFDLKPWLFGGLAVLFLSLLLWAPFIVGITRYVSRLSRATERIALGKFDTKIEGVRRDELGSLGNSIEDMAKQLDGLVSGQKRFLGDVAHELCSPLARIRTGLGVMEHGLDPSHKVRLESIDEDVGELSDLVSEVLAFTKASTAPNSVNPETIDLLPLLEEVLEHECPGHEVEWRVPQDIKIRADRRLISRAVANVMRNAHRHAGEDCQLHIYAKAVDDDVELMIADDGPGVGPGVVSRLFEPFFRPDEARNREAGGAGLGMAIVHTAVEACGGSVSARRVDPHGLAILIVLPAA